MTPDDLLDQLESIAATVQGKVACAFDHPASHTRLERFASDPFIAASVIKVPILMEAFRQARDEGLDWSEVIPLRDADKVGGSGVLNVLHDGLNVTARDLAVLMTVVSDNTATNMMLDRLDVKKVNAYLTDHGCRHTRCVRKLYDWPAIQAGIHNYIAAAEITDLLVRLGHGCLISPEADAEIIAIMKKQQYREKIPHLLPDGAITATKSGSLDEVSHDCGLVYLPNGNWFALSVFVGDLDHSEEGPARDLVNQGIAQIALACYQYVNAV